MRTQDFAISRYPWAQAMAVSSAWDGDSDLPLRPARWRQSASLGAVSGTLGYRRLWSAMVARALADCGEPDVWVRDEALNWLVRSARTEDQGLTFAACCEGLGVDLDAARRAVVGARGSG